MDECAGQGSISCEREEILSVAVRREALADDAFGGFLLESQLAAGCVDIVAFFEAQGGLNAGVFENVAKCAALLVVGAFPLEAFDRVVGDQVNVRVKVPRDIAEPRRLVVGVVNDRAEEILKEVYKPIIDLGTPWIRADLPTAELVKVAANSFLATKISFINAMAEVCEAAGGDVTVLAKAIGYDPRIGSRFLQAGIGFGGGCLPKDIRAFMARAEELGAKQALEFLREIDAINLRARQRVIDVVRNELSQDLTQYKIAVLGATFKPDSDDVRDSPALDIAVQLHAAGAEVVVHDPHGIEPARKRFPNLKYSEVIEDAIKDADLILHLTEWKEYRQIDPAAISSLVKSKIIIDGRNMLDRTLWRNAGWKFHALGRSD